MNNGLELVPGFGAGKDQIAHRLAIQCTGGGNDIGPELLAYRFYSEATRCSKVVRDDIRIYYSGAPRGKEIGNAAFTRAYAPCQTYFEHIDAPRTTKNTNVQQTRSLTQQFLPLPKTARRGKHQ